MALFEVTDFDRKIYEEELRDFLPEKILDVHTHVWLESIRKKEALKPGEEKRTVSWTSVVARDNSIEDLQETYRLLFPGKEVTSLIFGNGGEPGPNNKYVQESAEKAGFPALYYTHPTMTADEVEAGIRAGGFVGVKSYLNTAPKYIPGAEIRIFDFFPKHQLARLNDMGAIAMLHIPRNGRLKDQVNIQQILEIKREFPKLRLIVAHVGRAYTKEDVGDAFTYLDTAPDLMYDFCANCCEYAITEVLKHAGVKHVMFGLDLPILRMRTHRIEENGTYINLVPPGIYGDISHDAHLREVSEEEGKKITFFAYEELLAFKRAAKTLGLTQDDVEDIMYRNAAQLIDGARRDIYGE